MRGFLIILLLWGFSAFSQCPNDFCADAIAVEEQSPESFCNYDCTSAFEIPFDPGWTFPAYPCHYPNDDLWYTIEVIHGGMVEFYVGTTPEEPYVDEDSTSIGNHGPLEGITMDILSGGELLRDGFCVGYPMLFCDL